MARNVKKADEDLGLPEGWFIKLMPDNRYALVRNERTRKYLTAMSEDGRKREALVFIQSQSKMI